MKVYEDGIVQELNYASYYSIILFTSHPKNPQTISDRGFPEAIFIIIWEIQVC